VLLLLAPVVVAIEAVGAAVSLCFRLALAAAKRAASLSCRITFKIRKKKA